MDVEVIAAAALYVGATFKYFLAYRRHIAAKKRIRKRRVWMQALHHERTSCSLNSRLTELLSGLTGDYFIRMSATDFEELLQKISPIIQKRDTCWRESIPAKIRLAITLRFLATGDSYTSLHRFFKISSSLVSRIIPEVCNAFIVVLEDLIRTPTSAEEWFRRAREFCFPHCLGALDGKHVSICSPSHTSPEDANYKGTFSMVLLTLVDSYHSFMYADVVPSQNTDSKLFKESALWFNVNTGNLNIPIYTTLPGDHFNMPYIFVTDGAFSLERHIMNPFPGYIDIDDSESIYNQLLYQSHSASVNTFGVLSNVFKVFLKPIYLEPSKSAAVIRSCLLLHNFLMKSESSRDIYCPPGSVDTYIDGGLFTQGSWRHQNQDHFLPLQKLSYTPDEEAVQIKLHFRDYIKDNATLYSEN